MAGIIQSLNGLIPFADPTRPLWQDAIYSIFLCTFLYFAPHIPFSQIWQTALAKIQIPSHRDTVHLVPTPGDEQVNRPNAEPANRQRLPPQPTVEDDIDSDSSNDSDNSLNDADLAALIRDFEQRGAVDDGDPGPADPQQNRGPQQLVPPPRRLRDPNRQVGAKKAKSLARRERVRAYNEFMREQGDMQRAQEASVAGEREKEMAEARARRKAAEAEIEERERRKREEKKVFREQREQEERDAVNRAVALVVDGLENEGRVQMSEVAKAVRRDAEWVEKLIRKEGILGLKNTRNGKVLTMLTSKGWFARVSESDLQKVQSEAVSFQGAATAKVSWTELGALLDGILRKQRVHS